MDKTLTQNTNMVDLNNTEYNFYWQLGCSQLHAKGVLCV